MPDVTTVQGVGDADAQAYVDRLVDIDPTETQDWLDSLEYVLNSKGPDRAKYLLSVLEAKARKVGVEIPTAANTPYINTIPVEKQPALPADHQIEFKIRSMIRWNAAAMVLRAGKRATRGSTIKRSAISRNAATAS